MQWNHLQLLTISLVYLLFLFLFHYSISSPFSLFAFSSLLFFSFILVSFLLYCCDVALGLFTRLYLKWRNLSENIVEFICMCIYTQPNEIRMRKTKSSKKWQRFKIVAFGTFSQDIMKYYEPFFCLVLVFACTLIITYQRGLYALFFYVKLFVAIRLVWSFFFFSDLTV